MASRETKHNMSELAKALKEMKEVPDQIQKKALTQAINHATRKIILPAVKDKINARTMDVPKNLKYRGSRMQSHTGPPGTLKRLMKVRAIKRSRVKVGRLVATPHRKDIAGAEDYPGYYPAFLEYQSSILGNAPRPYLRGTLEEEHSKVMRSVSSETRKRINKLYPRAKI